MERPWPAHCITLLISLSTIAYFIGSVQIDEAFEESFENKLRTIRRKQPDLFKDFTANEHAAQDVVRNAFQNIKVHCGTTRALPIVRFLVPGYPKNSDVVRLEFHK